MKKNKIPLETGFWTDDSITDPFELIDEFFDFEHHDGYKKVLQEMMVFTQKKEIFRKEYPGQLFVLYTAFRSFLRACYRLQFKGHQWKLKATEPVEAGCKLYLGSLTVEEFGDPFAVFKNAFAEKSLAEYDYFLCETVHLALSPYIDPSGKDMITLFFQFNKMLDAAQLLRERGIEKRG